MGSGAGSGNGNGKPKNKVGRPTKLTPDIQEQIVNLLTAGNYLTDAAWIVGLNPRRVFDWIQRGETSERGKYFEFRHAVERARAVATAADQAMQRNAGPAEWQKYAWRLERRRPQDWGRRIMEIQSPDLVRAIMELKDASIDQLTAEFFALVGSSQSRALESGDDAIEVEGSPVTDPVEGVSGLPAIPDKLPT